MLKPDIEPYRGQWIAVDCNDDTIAESADTLRDLHRELHARPGREVVIRRVPNLDDPIFVGLG